MQVADIRRRLVERARALGLAADSEEQLLDALLEREVDVAAPTDDECRRHYDEHPRQFRSGDLVEADHILFAVTANVPLAPLRERAQQVLDAVLAEPARFGALAAEYSNCPSAQVGGNLGQLARGDVVPEFWQAVDAFAGAGIVPSLIETRYGLHVLRINRRIEGRALPYETVRETIAARLTERNLQQALREYAHSLLHDGEAAMAAPAPAREGDDMPTADRHDGAGRRPGPPPGETSFIELRRRAH